jgi:hypothetical protein
MHELEDQAVSYVTTYAESISIRVSTARSMLHSHQHMQHYPTNYVSPRPRMSMSSESGEVLSTGSVKGGTYLLDMLSLLERLDENIAETLADCKRSIESPNIIGHIGGCTMTTPKMTKLAVEIAVFKLGMVEDAAARLTTQVDGLFPNLLERLSNESTQGRTKR